ncbi:MAG: radical SAM protein [Candidatus Nanohaloarchaea archaeon]
MGLRRDVRTGLKLLKARFTGKRIPLVVPIQLTGRCNLDCDYCSFDGEEYELGTEEVKDLLDELEELGTEKVVFTGGEPLVRNDIGTLVDYAKDRGLAVNVNSNGFSVPSRIDEIEDIDLLVLSLDGKKETHEKNRGEGSFDAVMRAASHAQEHGIKTRFTAVLTRESLEDVPWLLQKAEELGIPVNFQPVVQGGPKGVRKENLPREKLDSALEEIKEFKEENPGLVSPSTDTLEGLSRIYTAGGTIDCGRGRIAARVEGKEITPCARALPSERVEMEDGFADAWESLSGDPECNYTCCTSSLELANVWNLKPRTILNQALNGSY